MVEVEIDVYFHTIFWQLLMFVCVTSQIYIEREKFMIMENCWLMGKNYQKYIITTRE